jgi:hypothetical protein
LKTIFSISSLVAAGVWSAILPTNAQVNPSGPMTVACQRPLTIDHTKVPSTQSNFTVLVSLTDPALKTIANGGHVANANGYDIGFYADSGGTTKLKWEVEKYDGTAGNLIAWVKIPSVSSSTDTVFYLMYGNSAINTDQSDPPNTWDSNFKGVWHMGDNAANTIIKESTVTGANGTNNANTSSKTATGQIGNALSYNGSTDGSFAAINLSATNIATLSFWMKWTSNANDDHLAFEYTPNYNTNAGGFIADWDSSSFGGGKFEAGTGKGNFTYWTDLFARPSTATWHLVHLVYNRSGPINKVYVDGSLQTLTTGARNASGLGNFANSSLYFMSRAASALNAAGMLDEVQLSTIERNPNWVATEYNNQSSPGTFITMGSENCATPTPTPTATPTPSPTPPDNTFLTNLYAYYKLDETNGSATDASGNGKTLSNFGPAIGTTTGIINGARDFTGTAGTTLIRNANTTDFFCGANPFSFSFWVKFDTLPVTVNIGLCNRYEPYGRREYIVFLKQGTNKITFSIDAGDGVHRTAVAWGTAVTTGRWYFVAGGWDGTQIKLSVNGAPFAAAPYSTPMTNGGDNFKLGYEADSLDGLMDEFGFWIGRCLTQTEVGQLYDNGAGLPFSSFR